MTLHDLEHSLCLSEGVSSYEQLGMGPLTAHPAVVSFFKLAQPAPTAIPAITSHAILESMAQQLRSQHFSQEEGWTTVGPSSAFGFGPNTGGVTLSDKAARKLCAELTRQLCAAKGVKQLSDLGVVFSGDLWQTVTLMHKLVLQQRAAAEAASKSLANPLAGPGNQMRDDDEAAAGEADGSGKSLRKVREHTEQHTHTQCALLVEAFVVMNLVVQGW